MCRDDQLIIEKLNRELEEKDKKIAELEDKQKELRQLIRNRDGHIELLLEKEREFQRIQASRSYKIGRKIHGISESLIPGGSTRRFVLGIGLKVVRRPVKMMKFFTPHRIRKFFWLLKMGGMDAVKFRFRELEARELVDDIQLVTASHLDVTIPSVDKKSIDEYET